jgi:SAM-dependent methyltransferase
VGNVADEIQGLVKKYRARYIIFKDSTFIINRKWVMALCDELIKRKIDIHWRCNARVDLVDEELLRKMKRAGCRNISFGVESGSQRILDLLKKNTTIGQIKTAFKMVNKIGIETHASFIIASPMETKEEAKKTIELAKEIKPTFAQFGNGVAYPNTEYFDLGRQLGLIDEKWYTKTKKLYSETYLVDPSIGGEFKVDFDAEAIVKMAHREFYVRPAFLITAVKKIIRQPGFAFDLFKSGMALLGWINKKTGAKFKLPDFQLPFTSYSDPSIVYNYEGKMLKSIYERRIAICFDMMKKRYRRVLEIGAGSGVCIPSLLETADYVLGLDYHENMDKVKDTFTSRGYERFDLVRADAYKLPFSDSSFDLIIGVSVFEHLASNDKVVSECNRVLANDGEVILGIPVENAVLAGIRGIYYGIKYNVPIDHEIHAKDILNGFKRHFDIVEDRKLLPFTPFRLCFYYAARLKKRKI